MIADLIEHWNQCGVELAVDGDDLVYDAPPDVDIDELIDALRPRKTAIIAYLVGNRGLNGPCPECGNPIGHRTCGRVDCRQCSPKTGATAVVFNHETGEWDDLETAKTVARIKRERNQTLWANNASHRHAG